MLSLFVPVVSGQWKRVETGILAWLYAVHFVDEKTGWVGGSNGTLLSTSDGGLTWKKEQIAGTDTIRDIAFKNASEGWMLCERSQFGALKGSNRSYLIRTQDGGKSWHRIDFRSSTEPRTKIFFDEKGDGYAVGEGGLMSGLPLNEKLEKRFGLPLRYLIMDGVAVSGSRMLLVGGGGSSIWSDDRGINWQSSRFMTVRPDVKINSVAFIDDKRGWAAGNNGLILSTVDGGTSWKSESSGTSVNLIDIVFSSPRDGFAAGENGIILRSNDGGTTWKPEVSGSKHRLERLARAGDSVLAVGFGGTILIRKIVGQQGSYRIR